MNTTDTLKQGFLQKEIKITLSNFFLASLIYLTLPVVIFFIGYLKFGWAVLFSSLTVFSGYGQVFLFPVPDPCCSYIPLSGRRQRVLMVRRRPPRTLCDPV